MATQVLGGGRIAAVLLALEVGALLRELFGQPPHGGGDEAIGFLNGAMRLIDKARFPR